MATTNTLTTTKLPSSTQISTSSPSPTTTATATPFIHAIGGSIGTALSIFLCYPFERVRIELQKQAQQAQQQTTNGITFKDSNDEKHFCDTNINNDKDNPRKNGANEDDIVDSRRNNDRNEPTISNLQQRLPIIQRNRNSNKTKKSNNLFQCLYDLYQRKELYNGVVPIVVTMTISNFIFFYMNEYIKKHLLLLLLLPAKPTRTTTSQPRSVLIRMIIQLLQRRRRHLSLEINKNNNTHSNRNSSNNTETSYHVLIAACMAGIINVILTNPLWVINLRIITNDVQYIQQRDRQQRQSNTSNSMNNSNNNETKKSLSSTTTKSLTSVSSTELATPKSSPSSIRIMMNELFYSMQSLDRIQQLWTGTYASILLVSNPIIQFFIYDFLKKHYLNYTMNYNCNSINSKSNRADRTMPPLTKLRPLDAFLMGAIAKTIATILTYPLQLAQSMLRLDNNNKSIQQRQQQTHSSETKSECNHNNNINSGKTIVNKNSNNYTSTFDCIQKVYQNDGIYGLYYGMDAKLLQTVLTAACTYLTYEQIVYWLSKIVIVTEQKRKQQQQQ